MIAGRGRVKEEKRRKGNSFIRPEEGLGRAHGWVYAARNWEGKWKSRPRRVSLIAAIR
jgi:hypothetical protein